MSHLPERFPGHSARGLLLLAALMVPVPSLSAWPWAQEPAPEPRPEDALELLGDLRPSDLDSNAGRGAGPARSPIERSRAVRRYGGSDASEAAVERGLRWLAAHQSSDGRWSTRDFTRACPRDLACGPVHSTPGYDAGVTGLALLAFAGAGYTHRAGPYAEAVARALQWLKARQDPGGYFFDSTAAKPSGGMYGHGVCTFALGEVCAVSGDESLRELLDRAVRATERSQLAGGGWSYSTDPRERSSEFTLSVWTLLGLLAARKAGVAVAESALSRARDFVRTSTDLSGGVYYTRSSRMTAGATGAGAFARLMLGMTEGGWVEKGLDLLDRVPDFRPSFENEQAWDHLYAWYYRTLAGFQLQGRFWREWGEGLVGFLVATQRKGGHGAGAWPEGDYPGAGTLYSTAMCVLMLETYYRSPAVATGSGMSDLVAEAGRGSLGALEAPAPGAEPSESPAARIARERTQARNLLQSEKPEERYLGARRLSEWGDLESVDAMIRAAQRERGGLRAAHVLFIGRLRSELAIPFLVRELDDPDESIRSAALDALARTTGLTQNGVEGWKRWFGSWKRAEGPGR